MSPPLPKSPRDLKSDGSLKTKKKSCEFFCTPGRFSFAKLKPRQQTKEADLTEPCQVLPFFFSSLASLSLSRSLARSLPAWQPSRAVLAELQPVPACLNPCFPKKMLFANQLIDFQTGNCGSVTKSWHQQPLLLPNRLYRFHGSLPFTMDATFVLPDRGALEAIPCSRRDKKSAR